MKNPSKKTLHNDPETLEEALTGPDVEKLKLDMYEELHNLKRNETWDIVSLPKRKKTVKCKWVFKRKCNKNRQAEKCKPRLVARCYTQIEGIYYKETFNPVIKLKSIRTLLVFSVQQNWHAGQLDIIAAYLNGKLNETVFMELPLLKLHDKPNEDVCLLKKSLYGLHQSGRECNIRLGKFLKSVKLTRSRTDSYV